jgi:formate/nitrite transporter FocA (FNT family)
MFGLEGGCKAHPSSEDERNLRFIIITFGVGFTLCVVFGQRLFTSVVSLMTAVKGASCYVFLLS